jgi:superfamily II DNA or RNA helicase
MIALRDYQLPAVEQMARTKRGIVQAPAGSGKTIIAAAALAMWASPRSKLKKRKMRVAWIAHTTDQVDQAIRALAAFPAIQETCDITTACYAAGTPLAAFDIVILDECHHIAAPEFRKALQYHEGTRWGFSATPFRADDFKNDVFTLIGPIVHVVEREALVTAGQLAKAKVIIHTPNLKNEMEHEIKAAAQPLFEERKRRWPFRFRSQQSANEQMGRCVWQIAQEVGISCNVKRNVHIIELSRLHANDSHLIIVGSIEHGERLLAEIPGGILVFSKMGAKKRRQAIQAFASGEVKTMLATSLADEGLDVPRANVLTLAAAGKSAAKAEQRTGRVLRSFHDKTHGTVNDFMDHQHYFLHAQSKKRIALYRSLSYDIQFSNQQELLP